MSDTVHPYFVAKARQVFERAGGDPDNAGPLAAWAAAARPTNDSRRQVIVAVDGTILGESRYVPGRVGASYVVSTVNEQDRDLVKREAGLATGSLRARYRMAVIVVTFSQVCTGPGEGR